MIILVDFGSQTAHLIARRVKDSGQEVRIVSPDSAYKEAQTHRPSGIILSGGPASVYDGGAPKIDKRLFQLNIPVLGICYGWQLMAKLLGGKVIGGSKEYGPTVVRNSSNEERLFKSVPQAIKVWMSHGDEVVNLPEHFSYLASSLTVKAAAVGNIKKNLYGLQFHPEVEHTEDGIKILHNFIEHICHLDISEKKLNVEKVIEQVREKAEMEGKSSQAIAAVSGGVDSTVAAAIVAKALGKRFTPVYCENGLMRQGTREEVVYIFSKLLGIKPVIVDCKKDFLAALEGIRDPEDKRKTIGALYIKIFEKEAQQHKEADFLVQGTIYSDVIESQGSKHAARIKSHHNVGGLPETMKLKLIEPLREFYKDEVRELGRQLGLPEEVLMKHPFPGPGQAIRILGEITEERLQKQQQADQIVLEVMKETGWYDKVFQCFPVMTGALTTAVKGDGRTYGELVGLRVYDSNDVMTAGWTHLPYEILQLISTRIVNEVAGVSRVAYDITTKPPATMEWE